ncbi:hypothetical protein [Levilactobacillus fujinensis]|uniref:hypothetical protein n=1 Tax=Levilactobacillus fujinensis TaxID=2486024 RepID=UPI0036D2FBDC
METKIGKLSPVIALPASKYGLERCEPNLKPHVDPWQSLPCVQHRHKKQRYLDIDRNRCPDNAV